MSDRRGKEGEEEAAHSNSHCSLVKFAEASRHLDVIRSTLLAEHVVELDDEGAAVVSRPAILLPLSFSGAGDKTKG